ncbi:MAG TPA: LPS assembly lipoprotein LptE [Pirellulales bacterium]|nr:LPS assembly lipoprotein LptE [Pirellulales bacterium]
MRYMVGNRTLYPPDIQTVYVPMFDSTSFRRGLGEELTEAVVKEIELKTPFKVVNSPDADSVLAGKLVSDTKGVLVKPPTDEQRLVQIQYRVQVSWVDRRGSQIREMQSIPVPDASVMIDQTQNYVPEMGQSISTAQAQTVQRLAEQIVSLMEAPW